MSGDNSIRRGDIRWYRFKPPDKQRPVLILTRDSAIPYLNAITVAPITSTVRNIPSEVKLYREDGMPKDCAVNCDHLQTIPKKSVGPLITMASPAYLDMVSEAIRFAQNV